MLCGEDRVEVQRSLSLTDSCCALWSPEGERLRKAALIQSSLRARGEFIFLNFWNLKVELSGFLALHALRPCCLSLPWHCCASHLFNGHRTKKQVK